VTGDEFFSVVLLRLGSPPPVHTHGHGGMKAPETVAEQALYLKHEIRELQDSIEWKVNFKLMAMEYGMLPSVRNGKRHHTDVEWTNLLSNYRKWWREQCETRSSLR